MKTVFMYAGQGSQRVGMGKDMYEEFAEYRNVADSVSLPFDFKTLAEEGPIEKLSDTRYTQSTMAVFQAGVTAVLKANGIEPDGTLGLSLGEYSALHAAGAFDAATLADITYFRGNAMADAAVGHKCSMSAILGLKSEEVLNVVENVTDFGFVTLANYNCPGQYVICGDEEAVAECETRLKEKGALKCVRLNVSGPFHTKYMAPAAEKLFDKLNSVEISPLTVPVGKNTTGDWYGRTEDIKPVLKEQVMSSVHFEDSILKFMQEGADTFIEIGPGKALTGFAKKTAKANGYDIEVITLDSAGDVKKLLEAWSVK